ncbi:MAG: integration host factor subunit beta [Deltaproteobacteria bacterium]|nr:MAG: integration host factor subunit beta [Deltaproteobacteria bacterium]
MTKSELIAAMSEKRRDISKKDIEMVVNTIFDSMRQALIDNDRIEIRGFGSFTIKHREARQGRNPKTGSSVSIPSKRVPFFTVGKELRERVNNGQ